MNEIKHHEVLQMMGQDFVNDFLYYSDWANPEDSIEHYGILGMKWGIIRTPKQLGHEPEGGKDYKAKEGKDPNAKEKRERKSLGDKIKDAKKAKQRKKNLEKARAAKAKKKEEAKEKEEILKDPTKLYQNRDKFTKKELDDAIARFQTEARLQQLSDQQKEAGRQKVQNVVRALKTGADALESGTKFYNNFANIYNTFKSGDAKALPIITTGKGKKQDSKKSNDDDDDDNDSSSSSNKSTSKPSSQSKPSDIPNEASGNRILDDSPSYKSRTDNSGREYEPEQDKPMKIKKRKGKK